jgi:hypothetical protein
MYRSITSCLVAVLALLFGAFAAPLTAQTQGADATASVVIAANLTVTNTRGMDFGTVFSSAGIVRTSNANSAEWDGDIDPGNSISVTFTLPSALLRQGGGGNGDVPFSCNTISGGFLFGGDGGDREFNPYLGSGPYLVGGNDFRLALGRENSVPDYGCKLDVTGRSSGTYTGIITATVSVL